MRDLGVVLGQNPNDAQRGWLGVSIDETDRGVRVTEVTDSSPAGQGGVRVGDLLAGVDGNDVPDFDALVDAIGGRPPQAEVTLSVVRTVGLALGAPPADAAEAPPEPRQPRRPEPPAPAAGGPGYLGVELSGEDQVRIDRVVEGSPAEKAGLRAGDMIIAIDADAVGSIEDLAGAIAEAGAGSEVVLDLLRDEGEQFERVAVKLGARGVPAAPAAPGRRGVLMDERMRVLETEMRQLTEDYRARMRDLAGEMQAIDREMGREPRQLDFQFGSAGEGEWRQQVERARAEAERARAEALRMVERERAQAEELRERALLEARRAESRESERSTELRDQVRSLSDEVRSLRDEVRQLQRVLADMRSDSGR